MASTAAGRALTDAHRIAQIRKTKPAIVESRAITKVLLDPANLDGSFPSWAAAQLSLAQSYYSESAGLAKTYLVEFAQAELAVPEGISLRPAALSTTETATMLRIEGPVAAKTYIGKGMDPAKAVATMSSHVANRIQQSALAGGRGLVMRSRPRGRPGRWRRVSDGQPCAFCAMLCTRGPVYTAQTVHFRTHELCGCGVEQVIGEWEPTELEARWIDAYETVGEEADIVDGKRVAPKPKYREDTILWRMRRLPSGLFSDSIPVK